MNSLLGLNIRERFGLTYNIYSFYSPYVDSGIWGIYYACEAGNRERIRRLVQKELYNLIHKPLGQIRLSRAKKQLTGQLILGAESLLGQMLGQGKDLLDFDHLIPFSEYLEAIEAITALDLQDAAAEVFAPEHQTILTYRAG